MATGHLEELMVSVRPPVARSNGVTALEARRRATANAREQLVRWLSEQSSDFEVLPDSAERPLTPLFVVRTYARSLVEKLLNKSDRPQFIRGAEYRAKCKFSLPDSNE